MIFNLFRKSPPTAAARDCYRAIVAQSRQEKFYAQWGVPDTVTGRFNMVVIHLALLLRRLKSESSARDFVQALVDRFFEDMDQSHRELGVTDLGVPRQVRRVGDLFYGLAGAIGVALDHASKDELVAVLIRNIYADQPTPHASDLATYIEAETARLAAAPTAEILAGSVQGAAA